MAVIDSNNFITHLVHLIWSGLIDKAACGELKEAIELCTVKDVYTKADLVAMLTELQLEIEEQKNRKLTEDECRFKFGISTASNVIQQKIDKLKGE